MNKIKNILFIQSAGGVINFSTPLGLGYLVTHLKNKLPNISVKIVDLSVEKMI